MNPIMMTENGDKHHLDYVTRQRMTDSSELITKDNEFWIMLLMVLFIFGLGFLTGNIAHDKCCHVIEQLQSK